jgi:hypothetical protein
MNRHRATRPGIVMLALTSIALCLSSCTAWQASADAGRDIDQGTLRLKTYGLPPRGESEYARLLEERYGVELNRVAGCAVMEPTIEYVRHYNNRMIREMERRHGPIDLGALRDEAYEQWQTTRADEPPPS